MDELLQIEADLERLKLDAKRMVLEIANQFCGDASSTKSKLLSPEDFRVRWSISIAEYDELIAIGLPVIRFASGVIRHSEVAVDEFFRQQAAQMQKDRLLESLTERMIFAVEQVAARLPNLAGPPMTVDQVAKFASVSEKTIYRWVATCKLKPKADGARPLLFERSEVDKALSRS